MYHKKVNDRISPNKTYILSNFEDLSAKLSVKKLLKLEITSDIVDKKLGRFDLILDMVK